MSTTTKSNKKPFLVIGGTIAAVALGLFAYLMGFTAPEHVTESVKLIAITEKGCVVETMDGHAITVEKCTGQPGDTIVVQYDKKIKERAAAMNP